MLKELSNKLKGLINKIKQKKLKNNKKHNKIQYETLLPENNIENKSEDILDYAVKKANVNNIAITGGYSAGKSSIINSYFKKIKKVKFISLATFKKEKNDKKTEQNPQKKTIKFYKKNGNTTIQEVEKTILEKLYYSSYVKKSKRKKCYHILITTFIFYILFTFIYNNIVNFALKLHPIIELIFILIIEIFTFLLIYFVIRKISEFTSLKLKLGEIEVDATIKERNILNENLNMIIEIIKKAKYKYIIFEDLDRFECPEIFEHLRDLNITLNSALVKPVKFIYAVRDDIFENENRTKFFDMIIPVVPYVSFENSGTKMYEIIKEKYKLPELEENFIKKLCLFVADMRILKNTLNEYVVYKTELDNPKLSKETSFYKNLFAMMLYKNTCSHDFSLLQQHDGIVFSILNNGKKYKKEKINQINEKIDSYNKEENLIENEYIYDKNYFIDVLLVEIIRKFPSNDRIKIANNESVPLSISMNRSIFEEDLFSPNFKIYHYAKGAHEWITMAEFLEQNLQDLYQKYKLVRGKETNAIKEIEIRKKECEQEKRRIEKLTIKEMINNEHTSILDGIQLGKYTPLIRFLIAEGYINENYSNYINKFYDDPNDNAYILSIRSREKLPFQATIKNPKKVIEMLEAKEFERVEILNMTILDTLFSNAKYGNKLKSFLTVFALNKDYIEMLKQCVLNSNFRNKEKLLATIFNSDQGIWNRIEIFIQSKKEKEKFLKAILQILDFNILKEHEQKHMIETYISENNIFIDNISKMKQLLADFQIKYKDISKINIIDKIMPNIIETNSYEINHNNIEIILKQNKIQAERIENKNYEAIQEIEIVSKYIDSNIEEYINNVYLKLEKQQINSEQALIKLLNIETLSTELIEKILEKETIKIKNIGELNENIWNIVLDKEKIQSSYTNINQYYEKNGLNDTLINYINTIENLKSIVTLKENESVEQYLNKKLVEEIISENEIKLSLYKEIVLNTKIKYHYMSVSYLDEEKVICLMENNIFVFGTEMYKRIRECNANIFILYTNKYIRNIQGKNIKDIDYNIDEINILVDSNKISLNLKRKIIENIKEEDIESMPSEVVNNICNCILKFKIKNNLSFNMLMKILNENRTIQEKVEVIVYNLKLVNINNIKDILKKLDDNYLKIIKDRTTPSFKYTIYNEELIKKVQSLGYHIEYITESNYIKLKGTKRGNPAA